MRKVTLAFVLSLLSSTAIAAGTQTVTINSTTFTDLGAAPVSVQTLNQSVAIVVSDGQPSPGTAGNNLFPGPPVTFQPADSSSHVWAGMLGNPTPVVYAPSPLTISGSFSASVGGFTPSSSGARMTPLTVTTSDSSGPLPTGGVVVVSDVGPNPMYCNVNGIAATVSDVLISSDSWFAFTVPVGVSALHCIATGGSTTANGVGGSGVATGAVAGAAAAGAVTSNQGTPALPASAWPMSITDYGGVNQVGVNAAHQLDVTGPVTVAGGGFASGALSVGSGADGWNVTEGAKADTAYAGSGSASAIAALKGIYNVLVAALPAGTNLIGKVGIDQTTPGTTNNITASFIPHAPVVGATGAITSLVLKASATSSPGGLVWAHAENATATAGYCIIYNAASAPSTGPLTAASVLDFQAIPASGYCDFDLSTHPINASTGVVVLLSSAATPYTYTTGAITGSIAGSAL